MATLFVILLTSIAILIWQTNMATADLQCYEGKDTEENIERKPIGKENAMKSVQCPGAEVCVKVKGTLNTDYKCAVKKDALRHADCKGLPSTSKAFASCKSKCCWCNWDDCNAQKGWKWSTSTTTTTTTTIPTTTAAPATAKPGKTITKDTTLNDGKGNGGGSGSSKETVPSKDESNCGFGVGDGLAIVFVPATVVLIVVLIVLQVTGAKKLKKTQRDLKETQQELKASQAGDGLSETKKELEKASVAALTWEEKCFRANEKMNLYKDQIAELQEKAKNQPPQSKHTTPVQGSKFSKMKKSADLEG